MSTLCSQTSANLTGPATLRRLQWIALSVLLLTLLLTATASADPVNRKIKLNGSLVSGGEVIDFLISLDSSRVVYKADQDTDEQFELFVTLDQVLAASDSTVYLPLVLRE